MAQYKKTFVYRTDTTVCGKGAGNCFACSNGQTLLSTTSDPLGSDVTLSTKNPRWRRQVALGQSATTAFGANVVDLEWTPGHLSYRKWCNAAAAKSWSYYYHDGYLSSVVHVRDWPSAPSTVESQIANNKALMQAVSSARAKQGAFRGSTFLAEIVDTIRMIKHPAASLRRGIDDYVRAAKRSARKSVPRGQYPRSPGQFRELERSNPRAAGAIGRAVAGSWLEHSYGWLPLISDISDAAKAAAALSRRRPPTRRFYGQGDEDSVTISSQNSLYGGTIEMWAEVHTHALFSVRYLGAVKLQVDSLSSSYADELGFRPRDFLPAVWEVIPYSFLVDYFTNIGQIVDALSFPRSDIAWMQKTIRNRTVREVSRATVNDTSSLVYPTSGAKEIISFVPSRASFDRSVISRNIYTGSLVPPLQFKLPGSGRRWLNIAALASLRSLFR